jgi:RNA polymerase sigma factor (sigma-70 family)
MTSKTPPSSPVGDLPNPVRQLFDASFFKMLESGTVISRIGWLLYKYKIQADMEIDDVICEGYLRAIKSIESGKEITNLNGWFRSTTHNIVREQFRVKQRHKKITDSLIQEHDPIFSGKTILSYTPDHVKLNELWSRLEQLKPLERKILILQAQGRSMQQIAEQLIRDEDLSDSPNSSSMALT